MGISMVRTLSSGYSQLLRLPARTITAPAGDSGQPLAPRKQSATVTKREYIEMEAFVRRVAWIRHASQKEVPDADETSAV